MNAKTAIKTQSFRNCRLQILKGEHSLQTQDGGDCVVEVLGDPHSHSLDIRIRNGKSTLLCVLPNTLILNRVEIDLLTGLSSPGSEYMPSFRVTKDTDHCQMGRLRYLIDLPEQNFSVLLSFTHREGKFYQVYKADESVKQRK